MIEHEYQTIDHKLKSREYLSFQQYLDELLMFRDFLYENSPQGPGQKSIIMENLFEMLQEGSWALQEEPWNARARLAPHTCADSRPRSLVLYQRFVASGSDTSRFM